jgi:hypothetical protein
MELILLLVLLVGAFIFFGLFGKIIEFFLWLFTTAFAFIFTFLWSGLMFVVGLFVVIFLISMALSNL